MKICIVSNSHPSNDIRLYYKLAHSLAKLGEVHLITTTGVSNSSLNPFQETVNSESNWGSLSLLYHTARKYKPDLVICVEPATVLVGLLLRLTCRSKLVFDVHEFFPDAFAERFPLPFRLPAKYFYLALEKWLERRVQLTIGVNREILKELVPASRLDKALYLPNYPVKNVWDLSCEVPGGIGELCEMSFDLIYIGGLTEDRGIFKLLKVISYLKADFPNLTVLIVGKFFNEETQSRFNSDVTNYNLNKHIYYQEWIPAEKIGLLLKRSRFGLWLFNPRNRRMSQAMPLKVMEYLAAGLPVVTVKTPLMSALIEKNKLGAAASFQALPIAKALGDLLTLSENDYQAMSKRCSDIAESRFNWEAVEPELLSAVKALFTS